MDVKTAMWTLVHVRILCDRVMQAGEKRRIQEYSTMAKANTKRFLTPLDGNQREWRGHAAVS